MQRDAMGNGAWFVVRAQPRKEALAQLNLRNQGFETYLPLALAPPRPRANTRRKPVSGPQHKAFFPGYLFVRLDLTRGRWRSVNGTLGVIGLVQFGETPCPAPRGFVERLIASTRTDGVLGPPVPIPVGARVQIVGGPFDSHVGTLVSAEPGERVRILLDLLGRVTPVEAPRHGLIAV